MSPLDCELTRYGKSLEAGGWDDYQDGGTDAGMGCRSSILPDGTIINPLIDGVTCALSKPAEEALGCEVGSWLDILLPDGRIVQRQFNDRTSPDLTNARVDFYCEWKDDPTIPETGKVIAIRANPLRPS